LPINVSG